MQTSIPVSPEASEIFSAKSACSLPELRGIFSKTCT